MRVVERREEHRRVFRGTCYKCKSVLEEDDESKLHIEHGYQREPGDFARVGCPVCQGAVILYPQKPYGGRVPGF